VLVIYRASKLREQRGGGEGGERERERERERNSQLKLKKEELGKMSARMRAVRFVKFILINLILANLI
jgi:hypothetical protein